MEFRAKQRTEAENRQQILQWQNARPSDLVGGSYNDMLFPEYGMHVTSGSQTLSIFSLGSLMEAGMASTLAS